MATLKNLRREEAEFSEAEIQQVMSDYNLRELFYTAAETQKKLKTCRTNYWLAKKSGVLDTTRDGRLSKHSGRQIAIAFLRMQRRSQEAASVKQRLPASDSWDRNVGTSA